MFLCIIETAWWINRANGKSGKKVRSVRLVRCVRGKTVRGGAVGRYYTIDELQKGKSVTFSVRSENSDLVKTFTLLRGKRVFYCPRSFDGGYYYTFRLI